MIKHFKELITSVDLLNTLHGGISEPFLSFREDIAGREMRVRVPGLAKEALRVAPQASYFMGSRSKLRAWNPSRPNLPRSREFPQ